MAVRVDEARADDAPGGVDHALGALAVDVADRDDPPALDRDVAAERRGARAVDDERVPDEEVEPS